MASSTHSVPLIYLFEDNEPDALLVRMALEKQLTTFELQTANEGEEAIRLIDRVDGDLESAPPSIVLLDLNLPRKSGEDILKKLRTSQRCRTAPVVVISSSESPLEKARIRELGATAYFQKSSDLAEFLQIGSLVQRLLYGSTHRLTGSSL
ncbi:MAG TPA: response regulator [Bryobacteraceae bacterium]|jgi:Response regulators consisting of a CheY-like receiver domain and a winged-helix DNA-binding domain|nr:response regulator [Bryobacteraceae bacterium]